jgi:hypothetical protein
MDGWTDGWMDGWMIDCGGIEKVDCGRYSTGNIDRGLWWIQDEGIKTKNSFRYVRSTKITLS